MESPILLNFVLWHMINLINTLPIHPFIHLESYSPMTSLPLFVIKKEKLNYSIFWFLSIFDKFLILIHKTMEKKYLIIMTFTLSWMCLSMFLSLRYEVMSYFSFYRDDFSCALWWNIDPIVFMTYPKTAEETKVMKIT